MRKSNELSRLMKLLSRLPGIGPRSAQRIALELAQKREGLARPLGQALAAVADTLVTCSRCGNIDSFSPCSLCQDSSRTSGTLCIVENIGDLWSMERAACYQGQYYVLGGVLSALDGIGPEDLSLETLLSRLHQETFDEVILALSATVDGQTTVHYLMSHFPAHLKITRLAQGLPMGGSLDYLDEGTITAALKSRKILEN